MNFEETKWFDILFDNENHIYEMIKSSGQSCITKLFKNGVLVAIREITEKGAKFSYL